MSIETLILSAKKQKKKKRGGRKYIVSYTEKDGIYIHCNYIIQGRDTMM